MANSDFVDLSQSAIKLGECVGHEDEIRAISFSNNLRYVYSGGWDNRILRWNLPVENTICTNSKKYLAQATAYVGHKASITSLGISYDDKYLFSSSKDGTVKIWDNLSHSELFSLDHDHHKVFALHITNDYNHLISGGEDLKVRIWKIVKKGSSIVDARCIHDNFIFYFSNAINFRDNIKNTKAFIKYRHFTANCYGSVVGCGDAKRLEIIVTNCLLHPFLQLARLRSRINVLS